jgi:hypothetical protein
MVSEAIGEIGVPSVPVCRVRLLQENPAGCAATSMTICVPVMSLAKHFLRHRRHGLKGSFLALLNFEWGDVAPGRGFAQARGLEPQRIGPLVAIVAGDAWPL